MRTTLEIESKIAEKIRELAQAQNVSIDQLLAAYVPGLAADEPKKNGSEAEDHAQAFEEWAASFPTDTPPLSDQAISRASIYADR